MKSTTKKHKVWICLLPLLFLCFSLVFASSPGERKPATDQDAAKFKGQPDNRGREPGNANRGSLAALPIPPIPPYEPVPMTARVGFTGLVTYNNTNGVAMINPANHTISPVLLNEYEEGVGGPLGSEGGGRFDVAMTRDGRQALISNFGDSKVFFVDLSSGAPVVTGMVEIDFFAEDIAIHPSNEWALVSDGGFSPRLAVLHIPTRTWVPAGYDDVTGDPYSYHIVNEGDPSDPDDDAECYANAVAIAPDGRTVIVADYFGGYLHALLFDPATGSLAYSQSSEQLWKQGTDGTEPFIFLYRPVNVAISPDGRTVIGVNCVRSTYPDDPDPDAYFEGCNLPVFTLDAPGQITRRNDVIFPNRVSGGQTLVFSPDGRRAYLHTNYWDDEPDPYDETLYWVYSEVQVLAVNGPGLVSHVGAMRAPTERGTSQLFGVDNLAITPDGGFLYATNPTVSGASPVIDVFDLRAQSHIKQIGTPTNYPDPIDPEVLTIEWVLPTGIAFPAVPPNRAPQAVITVDKSELILDIPEFATFDGSASSDPEGSPLTYQWSLVSTPAGAAATLTPNGATAVLTPDPNLVGAYQVGLVVSDGRLQSDMATAFVTTKFYPVLPPAAAAVLRLEDNYIFYKEYVNRLTWSANPGNLSTLEAVKVYRKQKGAADADYALLATLPASATGYDDKGLSASQLFTYRITSVNTRGVESDPVVVGN